MSDRKTVRKWFWVWDYEKEERWLDEMAMQGWVLDRVGWRTFHFRRCEPGEYTVRTEMRTADESYIAFMEETGAEYIGRVFAWVYFRKRTANGTFDLYSDVDSRIAHLNRIGRMLCIISGFNLIMGILNISRGSSVGWINILNISRGSFVGWINMLCATVLMYALGRIHGKKEALERARQLHE